MNSRTCSSIAKKIYRLVFKEYRIHIEDKNPPFPFNCMHEGFIETPIAFRTFEGAKAFCNLMNGRVAKDTVSFIVVMYHPWFMQVYDQCEWYVRCVYQWATEGA